MAASSSIVSTRPRDILLFYQTILRTLAHSSRHTPRAVGGIAKNVATFTSGLRHAERAYYYPSTTGLRWHGRHRLTVVLKSRVDIVRRQPQPRITARRQKQLGIYPFIQC